MKNKDLHNTHLYIVNGIICSLSIEGKSYPTIQDVKNNWQFSFDDITDDEINKIITAVKRMDNYIK